jgi:hypothetical protein
MGYGLWEASRITVRICHTICGCYIRDIVKTVTLGIRVDIVTKVNNLCVRRVGLLFDVDTCFSTLTLSSSISASSNNGDLAEQSR